MKSVQEIFQLGVEAVLWKFFMETASPNATTFCSDAVTRSTSDYLLPRPRPMDKVPASSPTPSPLNILSSTCGPCKPGRASQCLHSWLVSISQLGRQPCHRLPPPGLYQPAQSTHVLISWMPIWLQAQLIQSGWEKTSPVRIELAIER